MKRRDLIRGFSLLPIGGAVGASVLPFESKASGTRKRDLFKELGIRTFINAAGTYTFMTASLMHESVVDTIRNTSTDFCLLDELEDKVGEKIAAMTHAEAAVVTSGAFAALTLGCAGVLSGTDKDKVSKLPFIEGTDIKSEVIIQKAHAIDYNHAFTNTGCRIVVVESVQDVESAINEKTALMHFLNVEADKGQIKHEEWVALGKKHGIPTSIDIAADVPPVSNLLKFNDMGFHFVTVSGGKAMRGPQSAGLLMGKKEVIAGARMHMPPRAANLGRGMKVNKEEILGMYVALEHFMSMDHDKEFKEFEKRIGLIEEAARSVSGAKTKIFVPPLGNITPTLEVSWDKPGLIAKDLQEKLRVGSPSIEVISQRENSINITVWVMKPGDEKIVARRLKEDLSAFLA
ncbi:MAG TPA: aminotransferase class V-fold PLP-dependent enzyme [Flavitalea sp.]|nr:aminotransferase class V-fold PLP-dependent enzyme [Flavitalea sp.]